MSEPAGAPSEKRTQRERPSFLTQIWRLLQAAVALLMLYSLVMHVVNKVALLATGAAAGATHRGIVASPPVAAPGVTVSLPEWVPEILIVCIIIGVLTYVVLKYVCESEWVKETVSVKECWEEVKWYNPWSWVKAIVCTIVEVVKWVLKQICKWVEVLVIVLVVACIVAGILVLVA